MTTVEVERKLGIGERTLQRLLARHPELRPSGHCQCGNAHIWTPEEIERVREFRARKAEAA